MRAHGLRILFYKAIWQKQSTAFDLDLSSAYRMITNNYRLFYFRKSCCI